MLILITTYPNNSRQLKHLIIAILKQWLAKCINRINYAKSYYLWEWELKREEEKILIIKTTEDKKEKLEAFIKKNHPYKVPELVWIKPDEVWEDYLKWITSK